MRRGLGAPAAVVLAAGLSRRMGSAKLLLELDGRPLVRWSVDAVRPHVGHLIVVLGREGARIREALAGADVMFVDNPCPEAGQGGSIAVGIAAVPSDANGAFVVLADQPRVPRSVYAGLVERLIRGGAAIVAPRYRGHQGTPVWFGRGMFPELASLTGDRGARPVVEAVPGRVALVDFDLEMPWDVDTPGDRVRRRVQ